jgi:hypothetical protein
LDHRRHLRVPRRPPPRASPPLFPLETAANESPAHDRSRQRQLRHPRSPPTAPLLDERCLLHSSPRHTSRPGMGPAALRQLPHARSLVCFFFFSFFQNAITCNLENMEYGGLWIKLYKYGLWIEDK